MSNVETLKKLGYAYPQQNIPAETWKLYGDVFAESDPALLARAVKNWIGREQWFPKIPDLRTELEAVVYEDGFDPRPWYIKQGWTKDKLDELLWEVEAERDPKWGTYCTDELATPQPPPRMA